MKVSHGVIVIYVMIAMLCGCYVLKQADQQHKLLRSARPIQDVIRQGELTEVQVNQLSHVSKVLDFAQRYGLNTKDAYQNFVWNPHDYISYVVYAAKPYELKSKTWWFPVVGRVPYLGFFNPKDARKKEEQLKSQGYETYLAGVAAFSSLGYFKDPVFRSMLDYSEISLSHLIFHELTHRTVWVASSVELNENLAEFVAEYLVHRFYDKTPYLDLYKQNLEERGRFKVWLKDFRSDLEKCFQGSSSQQCKNRIYDEYTGPRYQSAQLKRREQDWNNAVLLSYSLYEGDHSCFLGVFEEQGQDFGKFFAKLRKDRTCG